MRPKESWRKENAWKIA